MRLNLLDLCQIMDFSDSVRNLITIQCSIDKFWHDHLGWVNGLMNPNDPNPKNPIRNCTKKEGDLKTRKRTGGITKEIHFSFKFSTKHNYIVAASLIKDKQRYRPKWIYILWVFLSFTVRLTSGKLASADETVHAERAKASFSYQWPDLFFIVCNLFLG